MKYYEDPILGKGRAADVSGGTGGGTEYVFGPEFTVSGETVNVTALPQSSVVGLDDTLAGKQPTISSGATMDINIIGTAAQLGGATKQDVIDSAVASASGGGVAGNIATVSDVMTGVNGGTQTIVDVDSLRGGLTAGQAVDVTSEPDNFPSNQNYKGEFTWNRTTLGFASFPKYAPGLTYLVIADLTAISYVSVSPGGTWLDGTSTEIELTEEVVTRVAMLFHTADSCLFTFSTEGGVQVKNLREYEVTACSDDAIAYIAALSDPDSFQDYYLVKRDMVSPWTYIINMGTSPATTVAAGLAYQIDCTSGSHIITVDTCPVGYVGRDTFVRLLVGETGGVVVQSPLKLGTPLVANAINNCEVKYRDGEAVLTVTDTLGGYIVTDISGTTDGTLYYGLTTSGSFPYITFSPVTDGQTINMSGAVVSGAKIVVGNGAGSTTLTGTFKPDSQTQMSNLSLANVVVSSGGYMKLGNSVELSSGTSLSLDYATVQVNGGTVNGTMIVSRGTLQLSSAVGTGTIDLSSQNINVSSGASVSLSGVTIANGYRTSGLSAGGINCVSGSLVMSGVTISGCTAGGYPGGVLVGSNTTAATIESCAFIGNRAVQAYTVGGGMLVQKAGLTIKSCTFVGNSGVYGIGLGIAAAGNTILDGCDFGSAQTIRLNAATVSCTLTGSNHIYYMDGTGVAYIADGAVVDFTSTTLGNTISPGGGIVVASGDSTKSCTVIPYNGGASVVVSGGTYAVIKRDGTTA